MPIPESNETSEGAVGEEVDHHASQEQNDLESDSKGNLQHILSPTYVERVCGKKKLYMTFTIDFLINYWIILIICKRRLPNWGFEFISYM